MDANFSSSFLSLCANASGDSNTTSELWLLEDKTSGQVAASFLLLILVVGLPWNLLVVGIILKKKLYTQPTIILLLNLVLTDIFMLILTPFKVWVGFNGEYNFGGTDFTRCRICKVDVILVLFSLTALYTISYMSFDRFMFIYKPLKYDRIITCFRTLLVLGLTWIFTTLISILPLIGYGDALLDQHLLACVFDHSHNYLIVILTTALVPMVPSLVCNIWLLCIVQKNMTAIYSVRRSSSSADSNQEEDKFYKVMKKQLYEKQLHLVWVFGALICCNLVTWLPIIIRAIIFGVRGVEFLGKFSSATIVLFISQALLHPIVETALIKEVREPHRKIMLYCCVKIKSKLSSDIISSSPEPRHA